MKGTFIISIPEKYVISIPDIQGNETNPYFNVLADKYATNMLKRGWKLWNDDNKLNAEVKDFVVQEMLLVVALEGTVQYFNPFIKVAEQFIDEVIPEGLSNRTYFTTDMTDPYAPVEVENIHTWRTWRSPNHPLPAPIDVEGINYYFFMSATFGNTLTSDELMIIHQSENATLVDTIDTIPPVIEEKDEEEPIIE